MPRQARIDFPGLLHHVIIRGIEKRDIFRDASDYRDFLERLSRLIPETGVLCYAWALMRNHVHLLLQTVSTPIATLMQRLLTGYVTRFNLRYRRAGHLVQNRYKNIICEDEPYFLELVRYIPLNAVRAGLIKTPEELAKYPWSSYGATIGRADCPWLTVGPVLERFGKTLTGARRGYMAYLLEGWNKPRQEHLEGGGLIRSLGGMEGVLVAAARGERHMFDQRILGGGDFVERVLRQAAAAQEQSDGRQTLTLEEIMTEAAKNFGVDPSALSEPGKRPAVSKAKSVFLYAGVAWLKKTLTEMSRRISMRPGAASRVFRRGKELAKQIDFAARLEKRKGGTVP